MTPAGDTPPAPRRVLILKPSALGDVATAVPVLRGLRRSFPDAEVHWLVNDTYAPLVAEDPDLDAVIRFERRRLGRAWQSPEALGALARLLRDLQDARYDWVIDLQGLFRSGAFSAATRAPVRAGFANAREGAPLAYTIAHLPLSKHTLDRNIELARRLGIDARPDDLRLHVPEAGRRFRDAFADRAGGRDYVVFVPPTRWPTKCWPPRHWRRLAERLGDRAAIALIGTGGDRDLCARIADGLEGVTNLAGETDIPQMVGLLSGAACVVCGDSAAQHIAQGVGVDPVVLIGPTRPQRTGPRVRGRTVVADVPCRGCLRRRCRHITCMQLIDPRDVGRAVADVLEAPSRR